MKHVLSWLIPPFFSKWIKKIKRFYFRRRDILFDGDDVLFKKIVKDSRVYGEYGLGQSTQWVLRHTQAHILGVDFSKEWIDRFLKHDDAAQRCDVVWVDVGPLGDWGYPLSDQPQEKFLDYVQSLWQRDQQLDVVLIDGRFRVACFFYSLMNAAPGTSILFDDYRHRESYHVVEEIVAPCEYCGRQAHFVVPEHFDRDKAQVLFQRFLSEKA